MKQAEGWTRPVLENIIWTRIWLTFAVRLSEYAEDALFRLRGEEGEIYPLIPAGKKGEAKINITNPGGGRCIPPGTYLLETLLGKREWIPVRCGEFGPDRLDEAGQLFLYGNGQQAYEITFFADTEGEVVMTAANVRVRERTPAEKSLKGCLKRGYHFMMEDFLQAYYRFRHHRYRMRIPPLGEAGGAMRRVLFFTEQSDALHGNLLALKERMESRDLSDRFEIRSACRVAVTTKHLGFRSWLRTVRALAEADVVFMDDHAPVLDWLILGKDTIVTQLWHAGIGFKSSGYSRWGHIGAPPPFSCHRQYTYGVTGAESTRSTFAEIWGIDEERVIAAGMPRMDAFLTPGAGEEARKKMEEAFPIIRGKKVILFAPTYRGRNRRDASYPFENIDFERLKKACGDRWAVLFRMHPWVNGEVPIPESCRGLFADAGTIPEIRELYHVSDLLITDYSSNIYEYALLGRPMLFYAFDREAYAASRGFHLNYGEAAPGKVTETFEELACAIEQEDFEPEKAAAYRMRNFDYYDDRSSDRIIDRILLGGGRNS